MKICTVKLLISIFITILLSSVFIFASGFTSSPVIASCDQFQVQVSPNEPTNNDHITVKYGVIIYSKYTMFIVDDDSNELWKKELGQLDIGVYTEDINLSTISGIQVGKHYYVQVKSGANCGQAGFTVRDQNTPPSGESFTAPSGTFQNGTTTLPNIRVIDVNPGTTYRFRLYGMGNWSDYVEDENGHVMDFTPSGNVIEVNNICENGNSNRTDCGTPFDPGTYEIKLVLASNNDVKASTTFTVSGGSGTSGQNPCGPTGAECITALGPIKTNLGEFAGRILGIAIGLAGGIALILMVIGSIRVLTSSGDQQRLAGGRDMIVAAVAGLLFLVFSVLILRFIGVTLFGGTPGF